MSDNNIEIKQKTFASSNGTQIGVQYNNTGLSIQDAMQIAFSIFHEYYPQLRQDALADVEQLVTKKLQDIPPEQIVSPSPRIVVPTLQNASITEEKEIRILYANLLANSMDKIMKDGIHPSFVQIVNQLCPDEAKILDCFYWKKTIPIITLRAENDRHEGTDVVKDFSNIGEIAGCEKPLNIKLYFDNLIRLGLVDTYPLSSLTQKELYEPLKKHPYILSVSQDIERRKGEHSKPRFKEGFLSLSAFGQEFCEKCVINNITVEIYP